MTGDSKIGKLYLNTKHLNFENEFKCTLLLGTWYQRVIHYKMMHQRVLNMVKYIFIKEDDLNSILDF